MRSPLLVVGRLTAIAACLLACSSNEPKKPRQITDGGTDGGGTVDAGGQAGGGAGGQAGAGAGGQAGSDAGGGTAGQDGGGTAGATSGGGTAGQDGGGTAGQDGGGTAGQGGMDGGATDGGTTTLAACAPSQRVDTLRGVNGSVTMSAAGYGDKWVAAWFQVAAVSADNQYHYVARYFDGSALAPQIDLGIDVWGIASNVVSDGAGRAFVQRYVSSDAERRVFDFATGTFAAPTSFPAVKSGTGYFALAAIPGGGAISVYHNASNVVADEWTSGTWFQTDLAADPAIPFDPALAVNAAGQAIGGWYASDGAGGTSLWVGAALNGASWTPPGMHDFAVAGGYAQHFTYAALSNGDGLIAYEAGPNGDILSMRFHPLTNTFDAPVTVEAVSGSASTLPAMVVDASDRVTYAWLRAGHAYARRDLGAGLLATSDLGAASSVGLTLNPITGDVVALTFRTNTLEIQRIGATDATWPALVPANVGVSNGTNVRRQTAVVFDSAGEPTLITMQDASGTGGFELVYTKCQ